MSKLPEVYAMPIRVYFQDTDAGGVVYHASYVNFLERARTEWLRECCGYSNGGLLKEFGIVFVVRSLKLDYLKPAVLDDLLSVTAQVRETGRSRVVLLQKVLRGEDLMVEAEVHLVCVDRAKFKPVRIPVNVINKWKV
jgi:acyl-CoA thioester hydrolase